MFPLESVLLPDGELPLHVFEPRYRALVADCLAGPEPRFGVVLISAGREVGGGEKRCDVGVVAEIAEHRKLSLGRYALRCHTGERIRVGDWLPDDPYPRANVELWPDEPGARVSDVELLDVEERIVALFTRVATARGTRPPSREEMLGLPSPLGGDPGRRLYALASRLPMGQADRYAVLSAPSAAARLAALSEGLEAIAAMVEFSSR